MQRSIMCFASLKKRAQAIEYYYKAVIKLADNVDARLTLASLLLEENRHDEAIAVLCPPVESGTNIDKNSDACKLWWSNGKIKLKLAHIYKAKGSTEGFADVLFPVIRETLFLETLQQKVRVKPRLSRSVLSERVKVLDYHQSNNVFHGFKPVASSAMLFYLLYNIARAYHHVGLVTLAATYYEKILAIRVKDCPVPTLPNDSRDHQIEVKKPGYCDLRREAAYNLHLLYMKLGRS